MQPSPRAVGLPPRFNAQPLNPTHGRADWSPEATHQPVSEATATEEPSLSDFAFMMTFMGNNPAYSDKDPSKPKEIEFSYVPGKDISPVNVTTEEF